MGIVMTMVMLILQRLKQGGSILSFLTFFVVCTNAHSAPLPLLYGIDGNGTTVNAFDLDAQRVVASYYTGDAFQAESRFALSPDGSLYGQDGSGRAVNVYDLSTRTVAQRYDCVDGCSGLSFGPDGLLYISRGGFWVDAYDPTGFRLLTTYTFDGGIGGSFAMGPDGLLYTWAPDGLHVDAYVLGIPSVVVATYDTGEAINAGSGLTFGPDGHVYGIDGNGAFVIAFSLRENRVVATHLVATYSADGAINSAFNAGSGLVFGTRADIGAPVPLSPWVPVGGAVGAMCLVLWMNRRAKSD